MVSIDSSNVWMVNEERIFYSMHPSQMARSRDISTVRRAAPDISCSLQPQQQIQGNHPKRFVTGQQNAGPSTAVSRRNARERKRVKLVNQGFSTLRERVPRGSKNKKLSKVETLRAAIEYIRQLQDVLGMQQQNIFADNQFQCSENNTADDCSSVASTEDVGMPFRGSCGPTGGSGDLSPASSHPSEYSSPYASPDEHLLDMMWFQ